ncbi:MAG: NosD domain-containing protein [Sphingomonas sp.]
MTAFSRVSTQIMTMVTARALVIASIAAVAASGGPSSASPPEATAPVTPANIDEALDRASNGGTLVLSDGNYGTLTISNRSFPNKLTIDARAARFSGIVLRNVENVDLNGGWIIGPGGRSYGVSMVRTKFITLRNFQVSGSHRGIVLNQVENVTLFNNRLFDLISDGINIAYSKRVRVERNVCRNFRPSPATYDANGKLLADGDHPDCIQAWSRPEYDPTSDLVITNNYMIGQMQGIFLGNHVRDGVDDGGFDRVSILDNRITVAFPNGITVGGARGLQITGNSISTVPGSVLPNNTSVRVRAKLYAVDFTDGRICGNTVTDFPDGQGTRPC